MRQEIGLFWEPLDARVRERLRALVAALKGSNPLSPVTIVVPSTYAGLDLRHDLGRQGSANVQFLVLPRLTELLGAPSLAAQRRRPLAPLLESAAVRTVAAEAQGPLERVRKHPALHHTLQSSFRELRHATEEGLSRLAAQGELRAEVVRLYRLFRQRAEQLYYDRESQAQAAARAVRDQEAPGLRDLGPVVFFLISELSPGEEALVQALAEHWTCAVVLGHTGDAGADAPVQELADRLASVLGKPEAGPVPQRPTVAHLVVAPDPQQEVRWVLRRLLRAAQEGIPFHRMAVLYRQPSPYAALVREELSLSRVPLTGPGSITLTETAAGRTLLGLVHLAGSDLPRNELMAWLTSCPVATPGARRPAVLPPHWDAISRRGGLSGGWTNGGRDWSVTLGR